MKLKESIAKAYNPQKPYMIITYFGVNMLVEQKYKYIAVDKTGVVLLFIEQPGHTETTWSSKGEEQVVYYLNTTIDDWKETLSKISSAVTTND